MKAGGLVRASLRGEPEPPPPCDTCSARGANCVATGCCRDPGFTCYEKDGYFASCMQACEPGVHQSDDPAFQTSWSCVPLGTTCTASCTVAGGNCKASGCCRK